MSQKLAIGIAAMRALCRIPRNDSSAGFALRDQRVRFAAIGASSAGCFILLDGRPVVRHPEVGLS